MRKRRDTVEIQENWIDRIFEYVAPDVALQRRRSRVALAMTGGYVGGRKNRRSMSGWHVTNNDADGDILPDLETLRERSRDLIRNNPLASGAINTKVTNVVGTGLKLQSWIDHQFLGMTEEQAAEWEATAEREFELWAKSQNCDVTRMQNFYGIQELAFRSTLANGDSFVLLPYVPRVGSVYDLRIQLVEADRVCNPDRKMDTPELSGGVEKDQYGAPVAYYILTVHPGSIAGSMVRKWEKIPAFGDKTGRRNVLHLMKKERIGQTRGVPDLAPVTEMIRQLGEYTEAEVDAAVVSSLFTVFVKTETGDGLDNMEPVSETGGKKSDKDFKMGPAAMLDLMPGEDVVFADPKRPNVAFDPFVMAVLRQIGVALELPFEILVKHFTASYSAARAAMLEAWKFFKARREWLADYLCQPVYEAWMWEAVARGRLNAPGFFSDPAIRAAYLGAKWIGPARGQIDELKEVKAAKERVDMGISTLTQESAEYNGSDWEDLHAQRKKEVAMRREAGLEPQSESQDPGNPFEWKDNTDD